MTNPTEVINYICENFPVAKGVFDIHSREVCSALAYQFLLHKNGIVKSVEQILID